ITLGTIITSGRTRNGSPRVQHVRDVLNSTRPLRSTQGQVIVLAPGETGAKTSDLRDQRSPINSEMAYVVHRKQEVRRPIGFKERIRTTAIVVHLVLVRVNKIRIRGSVEKACHRKEC